MVSKVRIHKNSAEELYKLTQTSYQRDIEMQLNALKKYIIRFSDERASEAKK